MKAQSHWKMRLSLLFVTIFTVVFIVSGIINSSAYQEQLGSELLKSLSVGMGLIFWLWMMIDLMFKITHTEIIKNPWLWSFFVLMTYVIGAFIYFIVIYYHNHKVKNSEI